MKQVEKRVSDLEKWAIELIGNLKRWVREEIDRAYEFVPKTETYFGAYTALCVDTKDPF